MATTYFLSAAQSGQRIKLQKTTGAPTDAFTVFVGTRSETWTGNMYIEIVNDTNNVITFAGDDGVTLNALTGGILTIQHGEYARVCQIGGNQLLWDMHIYQTDPLTNVVLTSPAPGDSLFFDGTNWVNDTSVSSLVDLNDVTITAPADTQVLTYHASSSRWINLDLPAFPTFPTQLAELTDVVTTYATPDQVLTFDGSLWQAQNLPTPPALAQTLFVDPSGDDAHNNGSLEKPFATLQNAHDFANSQLDPNAYVYIFVAAGVYAGTTALTRPRTIVQGAGAQYGTVFTGSMTIAPTATVGNQFTSLFTLVDMYLQPTTGDALTVSGSADMSLNLDRVKAFGGAVGQKLMVVNTTSADKTVIRMTKFDGKNSAANIDAVTLANAIVSMDTVSIEAGDSHALVVSTGTSVNSIDNTLINASTAHNALHVVTGATYNNTGGTITNSSVGTGVFVDGSAALADTALVVATGGVAIDGSGTVTYAHLSFFGSSVVQNVTYTRASTSDLFVVKPAPFTVNTSAGATFDFGSSAQHNLYYRSTAATDMQVLVHADGTFTGTDDYTMNDFNPGSPGPMPVGGSASFKKQGSGNVVFVPDGGVTINTSVSLTLASGKATLIKVGPNEWDLDA